LDVNEKKFAWIKYTRANFSPNNLPMSKMMQLHARKYAKAMNIQKHNASAGWLDRFRNWYSFKNVNLHGEICDVNISAIGEEMKERRQKQAEYNLDWIFNRDETGLFFRCLPKRSFILGNEKESEVRGSITEPPLLPTTKSLKIPVAIIGKPKTPEFFKYIYILMLRNS